LVAIQISSSLKVTEIQELERPFPVTEKAIEQKQGNTESAPTELFSLEEVFLHSASVPS